MAMHLTIRRCLILASTTGFLLAGCSSEPDKKSELRRREGIAKTIDLNNNLVSMTFKDDQGGEHELRGTIREDTEVWINGRSHRLEDIREGDRVVVTGYQEGHGAEKKLVAVKVEVERPRDSDWKSTTKPEETASTTAKPALSQEKASDDSATGKVKKDDLTTGERTP